MGDFGVRKYDNGIGRFTSIDPMWEKYYGWTPYQYCFNNPIKLVDKTGNQPAIPESKMIGIRFLQNNPEGRRIATDQGLIVGGALALLTAPISGPVVSTASVILGSYSIAAGTVKTTADALGKPEVADLVPNSYFGAVVGKPTDVMLGTRYKTAEKGANFTQDILQTGLDLSSGIQGLPFLGNVRKFV